ncbi:hypothetical protein KCU89_g149, partial [Aureobasidium melanogenum]
MHHPRADVFIDRLRSVAGVEHNKYRRRAGIQSTVERSRESLQYSLPFPSLRAGVIRSNRNLVNACNSCPLVGVMESVSHPANQSWVDLFSWSSTRFLESVVRSGQSVPAIARLDYQQDIQSYKARGFDPDTTTAAVAVRRRIAELTIAHLGHHERAVIRYPKPREVLRSASAVIRWLMEKAMLVRLRRAGWFVVYTELLEHVSKDSNRPWRRLVSCCPEFTIAVVDGKVYEETPGFCKFRWMSLDHRDQQHSPLLAIVWLQKRRSCEDTESNNQDVDAPIGHIESLWNLIDFVNQRHTLLMIVIRGILVGVYSHNGSEDVHGLRIRMLSLWIVVESLTLFAIKVE